MGNDLAEKVHVCRMVMSAAEEQRVIQVSQFDSMTRIVMDLYNADGEPYNLPERNGEEDLIAPYMAIVRPTDEVDDDVSYYPGMNRVEYTVNQFATSMVGSFGCQLIIPGQSGNIVAGPRWRLVVKPSVYRGSFQRAQSLPGVEHSAFNVFSARLSELVDALAEVRQLGVKLLTNEKIYQALFGHEAPEGVTLEEALAGFVTEEELWRAVNGMATSQQVEDAVALLQPKLIPGGTIMSYNKAERRLALMISGALIASATMVGCWKDGERPQLATFLRGAVFAGTDAEAEAIESAINSLAGENGTLDAAEPDVYTLRVVAAGCFVTIDGEEAEASTTITVPHGQAKTVTIRVTPGDDTEFVANITNMIEFNGIAYEPVPTVSDGTLTFTIQLSSPSVTAESGLVSVSVPTQTVIPPYSGIVNVNGVNMTGNTYNGNGYTVSLDTINKKMTIAPAAGHRLTACEVDYNPTTIGADGKVVTDLTDGTLTVTVSAVSVWTVSASMSNGDVTILKGTEQINDGETVDDGETVTILFSPAGGYVADQYSKRDDGGLGNNWGYTAGIMSITGVVRQNIEAYVQGDPSQATVTIETDENCIVKMAGTLGEIDYPSGTVLRFERDAAATFKVYPAAGVNAEDIIISVEPMPEAGSRFAWGVSSSGAACYHINGYITLTARARTGKAQAALEDGILTVSRIDGAVIEDGILTIEIE